MALAEPTGVRAWSEYYVRANASVPTLEELAAEHPEAPPAALARLRLEHYEARRRDFESRIATLVAGVSTLTELETLPPEEILARWLEAHDPRTKLARLSQTMGRPLPIAAHELVTSSVRIVGQEPAGPDEVQVSWQEVDAGDRNSARETAVRETAVTWRLRRQSGGQWRVVLDEEFLMPWVTTAWVIDDPDTTAS